MQGNLAQQALGRTEQKLHATAPGKLQQGFEGLPRLVIRSGQPGSLAEKQHEQRLGPGKPDGAIRLDHLGQEFHPEPSHDAVAGDWLMVSS